MSGVKISALPAAVQANATDQLEANQSGVTRRVTLSQVTSYIATNSYGTDVYAETYGAVGDGVTDDTAALQAACNAAAARGGGRVVLSAGKYLIDSADLNLGHNVILTGSWLFPGSGPAADPLNFSAYRCVVLINPLYSIVMNTSASGVDGIACFNKNVFNAVTPTTLRQSMDRVRLFAGTAIRIGDGASGNGMDSTVRNSCFGGFDYGIYSNFASRPHIDQLFIDCNNGIHVTKCYDMDYISNVHCWPFITPGYGPVPFFVQYTVAGVANNGAGLVRIQTTAANILTTGDQSVVVRGVGGVPGADGTWTVTVIDSTHFDLQGSTFTGAYTSGGVVNVTSVSRPGVGINFDTDVDWGQLTTCFTYGYRVGIRIYNSSDTTLMNCGTDGYVAHANIQSVGVYVGGNTSKANTLVGCKTSAQGVNLLIEKTSPTENSVTVSNHRSWGPVAFAIQVRNGNASFVNCHVQQGAIVRLESTAGNVAFIGGDITGFVLSMAGGAPSPSFFEVTGAGNEVQQLRLTSRLTINGPDSINALITGLTKGVRFSFDGTGSNIEGVDSTGVGSLQPLILNGSYIQVAAFVYAVAAQFSSTIAVLANTAVGAGAATQSFIKASSTADLGLYYGTGAPTFSAAKGSIYTNTTATTTTTRLYVNTSGSTTWATLTTSA